MLRLTTILGLLLVPLATTLSANEPTGPVKDNEKRAPAAELLNAGLSQAKQENKRVFLVFGSPGCGWCKLLQKYHDDAEVAKTVGKYLVIVKVNVVDNPGGQEMYLKYGDQRGVPAWTFLDGDGKTLADSGNGRENVGFPYEPQEVTRYFKTFRQACPKLTDDEIALLTKKLKEVSPPRKEAEASAARP